MMRKIYTQSGFSLIELAIVLVVVALLLGGLLVPLTMQIEQQKIRETQKTMEEIKEALMGYAIAKGNLPCPAKSATDGSEDRTGTICTANKRSGFIPWAELGVGEHDAWGRRFRYSVDAEFSDSGTRFTLASTGDILIKATTADVNNIATAIPAAVMSHGKNGYLGTTEGNTVIANPSVTNIDEQTNAPASVGTLFVSKVITEDTAATGGDYDDLVTWLSPNILFSRMVAAGRLP